MRWKLSIEAAVLGLVALQASAQSNATETEGVVSVQGGYQHNPPPPPPPPAVTETTTIVSTLPPQILTVEVCTSKPIISECPSNTASTVTVTTTSIFNGEYKPPKPNCPPNQVSTVTVVTTSFVNGEYNPLPSNCNNCPKSCTPTSISTTTKTHTDVQHSTKTHTEWSTKTDRKSTRLNSSHWE